MADDCHDAAHDGRYHPGADTQRELLATLGAHLLDRARLVTGDVCLFVAVRLGPTSGDETIVGHHPRVTGVRDDTGRRRGQAQTPTQVGSLQSRVLG